MRRDVRRQLSLQGRAHRSCVCKTKVQRRHCGHAVVPSSLRKRFPLGYHYSCRYACLWQVCSGLSSTKAENFNNMLGMGLKPHLKDGELCRGVCKVPHQSSPHRSQLLWSSWEHFKDQGVVPEQSQGGEGLLWSLLRLSW